eukprot:TRINITY_DN6899_c2_g1_i2.p1 TRINITY_DN6899_c2_g1~~TRINITY_DN6899_c2_g1_i2.p1  ORF type:complete len:409 (+),score=47.57 TRINITY_DN6899_c2_g1_i2:47-1273(+)
MGRRSISWRIGRVVLLLLLWDVMLSVVATATPAPPGVNNTTAPAQDGSDSSDSAAAPVIVAVVIAVLTICGLFLYFYYSGTEKRRTRDDVYVDTANLIELEELQKEDASSPLPPAQKPPDSPIVVVPMTTDKRISLGSSKGAPLSTFSSMEGKRVGGYGYRIGDKVLCKPPPDYRSLECGTIVAINTNNNTYTIEFDDGVVSEIVPGDNIEPAGRFRKFDRVQLPEGKGTVIEHYPNLCYRVKIDRSGSIVTATESELLSSSMFSVGETVAARKGGASGRAQQGVIQRCSPDGASFTVLFQDGTEESGIDSSSILPIDVSTPISPSLRDRSFRKPLRKGLSQSMDSDRDFSKTFSSTQSDALEVLADLHNIVKTPMRGSSRGGFPTRPPSRKFKQADSPSGKIRHFDI